MAEVQAGVVTPVVVPASTDAPASESTADPIVESPIEGEPEAKPERTFTQKEVDEITAKRAAQAERRAHKAARAEHEAYMRGRAEAPGAQPQERGAADPDAEPDPKNFKDYESYTRAVARYEARQEFKQAESKRGAAHEQRVANEQARGDYARLMKGAREFEDFEDVVFAEDAPITRPMMAAILEGDNPSKLAHYLCSHRDEAEKIADLSPTRQAAKVHELEAKLSAAPKPTKTPAPIVPNRGGSGGSKSMLDMSQEEFEKHRKARLARK